MRSRRKRVHSVSLPAPIGGLNVVDGINDMPKTDAVQLTNWIAQQYGVRCRKGYREWAINIGGGAEIRTIFEYAPARASLAQYKLFCANDSNIYDITSSVNNPASAQALAGTSTGGRLSTQMMANAAGQYLLITSHVGGYKYFNGTVWATPTLGGGAGQISGCDPIKFCDVILFKRRAWFHEVGTCNLWYLPADSITGAAVKFDVGPQFQHGGVISSIARWTIDAGEGIDDFLVVVGENGDIVIYKGSDPASSATFGLVGVWYVGKVPVGKRATIPFGGDLMILSVNGLQPLSYVTRGGQTMLRTSAVDYLKKIQPLLGDMLASSADFLGWEMNMSYEENILLVQTPNQNTATREQYALYTNKNTWSKFTNMAMATAYGATNGFFFGTETGKVCQAFTGFFDNVPYGSAVGEGIPGIIQTSYSYFEYPGLEKQWTMIRPTFLAVDKPNVSISVIADFAQNFLSATPIYVNPTGSLWNTALWNTGVWAGALRTFQDWQAAGAIGKAGSAFMQTISVGDTFLASIDYMFEVGGEI